MYGQLDSKEIPNLLKNGNKRHVIFMNFEVEKFAPK
jgi:hypothetical protein